MSEKIVVDPNIDDLSTDVAEADGENGNSLSDNVKSSIDNAKVEKEYPPTFVDKFFIMHAKACERHADKGGIYNVVRWLVKQQELIVYLVVGVLTTIVSWGSKFLFNYFVYNNSSSHTDGQTLVLTIVNWTAGVIFAYFVSRAYVFKSHGPMLMEALKFVASRLTTFFTDLLVMWLLDTKLGMNFYVATLISAVIVTVLNYIFSKLLVFTKKKKPADNKQ